MGMFSWDCTSCHRSIRSYASVGAADRWMADAVALTPDGLRHSGSYDGYGRLGLVDLVDLADVEVRHAACDEVDGSPGYRRPSPDSADQGHFIDPADNPIDPRKDAR